ncbi:hypothetical protein MKMG_01031 [Methanogenium sp. MK-MG]|nr:hypothetical protein MKMG_01031 [Methanogenium sp. MK-MG]
MREETEAWVMLERGRFAVGSIPYVCWFFSGAAGYPFAISCSGLITSVSFGSGMRSGRVSGMDVAMKMTGTSSIPRCRAFVSMMA